MKLKDYIEIMQNKAIEIGPQIGVAVGSFIPTIVSLVLSKEQMLYWFFLAIAVIVLIVSWIFVFKDSIKGEVMARMLKRTDPALYRSCVLAQVYSSFANRKYRNQVIRASEIMITYEIGYLTSVPDAIRDYYPVVVMYDISGKKMQDITDLFFYCMSKKDSSLIQKMSDNIEYTLDGKPGNVHYEKEEKEIQILRLVGSSDTDKTDFNLSLQLKFEGKDGLYPKSHQRFVIFPKIFAFKPDDKIKLHVQCKIQDNRFLQSYGVKFHTSFSDENEGKPYVDLEDLHSESIVWEDYITTQDTDLLYMLEFYPK